MVLSSLLRLGGYLREHPVIHLRTGSVGTCQAFSRALAPGLRLVIPDDV